MIMMQTGYPASRLPPSPVGFGARPPTSSIIPMHPATICPRGVSRCNGPDWSRSA